jgi:hypothetical protein
VGRESHALGSRAHTSMRLANLSDSFRAITVDGMAFSSSVSLLHPPREGHLGRGKEKPWVLDAKGSPAERVNLAMDKPCVFQTATSLILQASLILGY